MLLGSFGNNDSLESIKNKVLQKMLPILSGDLSQIILFGSYARGDYREDSDMDVAVITESGNDDYDKVTDIIYDVMKEYGVVLNPIFLCKKDYDERKNWYPFYQSISNEGVIWYPVCSNGRSRCSQI